MRNRSPERTTNILHQKDLRALKQLESDLEKWVNRAEKCGCDNCWRDVEPAYRRYINEYRRLMDKHEDHEEARIAQYALMKLEERKNDQQGGETSSGHAGQGSGIT